MANNTVIPKTLLSACERDKSVKPISPLLSSRSYFWVLRGLLTMSDESFYFYLVELHYKLLEKSVEKPYQTSLLKFIICYEFLL